MSTLHFSPRKNRAAEIDWRPWGEEAFAQAKEQNKPVLLAVSAVWCHWCHVMDETSYSDPSIIEQINARFIPVRVDNDQRPDVNARYNMGGWPTTALLTHEGEVLYGGTYLPPDAMQQILRHVDTLYASADNRLAVAKRVMEMKALRAARARTPEGGDLDPKTAANVVALLSSAFDEECGGFGTDQKFPHVSAMHFLLDYAARTRDERARTIVQRTLHAMADGGMYDHVEGGFFRYSTTRDFSVPHFEKMLEDLGGLLYACARAGAMFDDGSLRRVAVDVKRYLDERLWVGEYGAYGGSQDADEVYYALDAAGRARLPGPYVDRTIYTAWNAQAAGALLLSAPLLRNERVDRAIWTDRGLAILETIWTKLLDSGLMCRYFDGVAHVRGLFADQAWATWAALAAFSATGDALWLERSRELIESAEALYDKEAEGYLDRLAAPDDAGRVAEPLVIFEENALMAGVLLDYAACSGDAARADRAQAMLRRYARDYESKNIFAASYASAVLKVLEPPVDAHIIGAVSKPGAGALREAALTVASPPLRIDPIDPQERPARAAEFGLETDGAIAYLCRGTTCFAKVTSPGQLVATLAREETRAPLQSQ